MGYHRAPVSTAGPSQAGLLPGSCYWAPALILGRLYSISQRSGRTDPAGCYSAGRQGSAELSTSTASVNVLLGAQTWIASILAIPPWSKCEQKKKVYIRATRSGAVHLVATAPITSDFKEPRRLKHYAVLAVSGIGPIHTKGPRTARDGLEDPPAYGRTHPALTWVPTYYHSTYYRLPGSDDGMLSLPSLGRRQNTRCSTVRGWCFVALPKWVRR